MAKSMKVKQDEARARQAAYNKLTTQQKIDGLGRKVATRQRAKLSLQVGKQLIQTPTTPAQPTSLTSLLGNK
jgi:hypothetical protein